jgi:hypothetical protein
MPAEAISAHASCACHAADLAQVGGEGLLPQGTCDGATIGENAETLR